MASRELDRGDAGRFGRSASLLSAGIGVAGVLTYLFFSLASHNLSAADYGEIVVLWSVVFVTISVAYRPAEQLLSRTIAERRAHGESVGRALRLAGGFQLAIAVALTALLLAFRDQLESEILRSSNDTLYDALVISVACFGVSFYARGLLAGNRRFGVLAVLLIAEAAARAAFALAVALGASGGQTAIAIGVMAAPLTALLLFPLALSFARRRVDAPLSGAARVASEVSVARGGGFAAGVLVVMLGEQAMLNAGPLLINAFQDSAAAGFIFNILMVVRAPVLVFQGVAISLLPHLTRLRAGGERGTEAFRGSIAVTLRAVALFTALVVAGLAAVGPAAMRLAFGDEFSYGRGELVLVAVGMGCYLAATTLSQALLARAAAPAAARCWAIGAAAFLAWCLTPLVGDEILRVEIGFTAAAALLAALLARAELSAPDDGAIEPGSPEEIEARLASADEVG